MLHLPHSAALSKLAKSDPLPRVTRIERIMTQMEETLGLLFELEDNDTANLDEQNAIYDQYQALIEEASHLRPASEREAVYLFLLASADSDVTANCLTQTARNRYKSRMDRLSSNALSYFKSHRQFTPHSWRQFSIHSLIGD